MQDNYYDTYGMGDEEDMNDPSMNGASYAPDPYGFNAPQMSDGNMPSYGGGQSPYGGSQGGGGMNQMQMVGLMVASGMPFSKALLATAGAQRQGQVSALQQYKLQQQQQKSVAENQMFENLLNDDGSSPDNSGAMAPASGASTLAQMNDQTVPVSANGAAAPTDMSATPEDDTAAAVDPNNPQNIYSQMDDPNAVPNPTGSASLGGGGRATGPGSRGGKLDQHTKDVARLMFKAGDKKGAIKLIQSARAGAATLPGGFEKNPMMGPSRGGQGGTYTNPVTGKAISSDTNKNTSQDQATVAAIQRLEPMLNDVITQLPQFQRASTRAKAGIQGLANNYLGTNYKLPTEKADAESALNAAPDPLLKILGLPSTDKGLDTVRGIIAPQSGESPDYYKARVTKQLMRFRNDYAGAAKDRLLNGTVLQESNQPQQGQMMNNGGSAAPMAAAPSAPAMQPPAQGMAPQPMNSPPSLLSQLMAEKQRRAQSKSGR